MSSASPAVAAAAVAGEPTLPGTDDVNEDKWTPVTADHRLTPDTDHVTVSGLTTGQKYRFRLAAVNKAGPSPFVEIPLTMCAEVVGTLLFDVCVL